MQKWRRCVPRAGIALALSSCGSPTAVTPCAPSKEAVDTGSPSSVNYLTAHPAFNADGTINVVVEIPAGTTAKFEVAADGSKIVQDVVDGHPRFVSYLSYPANYGMVPRTLEDPDAGGDGDPLDVLLLGEAMPRGTVARARLIGVMRMLDGGERDDKMIAVSAGSAFGDVADVRQLDELFPGVKEILRTWFSNYKGPGRVVVEGVAGADEARAVLAVTARAYEARGPGAARD